MKIKFTPDVEETGLPLPSVLEYDVLDEETSQRTTRNYTATNNEDSDIKLLFNSSNGIVFVDSSGVELADEITIRPKENFNFRATVNQSVINNQIQTGITGTLRTSITAVKNGTSSFYRLVVTPNRVSMAPNESRIKLTVVLQKVSNGIVTEDNTPVELLTITSLDTQQAEVKNIQQLENGVSFDIDNKVGGNLNTIVRVEVSPTIVGQNGNVLRVNVPLSARINDLSEPPRLSSFTITPSNIRMTAEELLNSALVTRGNEGALYAVRGRLESVRFREVDINGVQTNPIVSIQNLATYLDELGYTGKFRLQNPTNYNEFDLKTFNGSFDILVPVENIMSNQGTFDDPSIPTPIQTNAVATVDINGVSRNVDILIYIEEQTNISGPGPFTPPNNNNDTDTDRDILI